jgi:hypothetical protein
MTSKIVERVAREAGIAELPAALAERLPASDLKSLLLHTFSARAARATEVELLRSFESKKAVRPSAVDARVFHAFEAEAYRLSEKGYSFGQVSVELADTDVVLALLAAAGIERAEVRSAARAHDPSGAARLLENAARDVPLRVFDPAKELSHLVDPTLLVRLVRAKDRVFAPLSARFPGVSFFIAPLRLEGLGYYAGLRLRLNVTLPDGTEISLGDGGFTTWTQRLLGNRRERFLASGIGTELACKILRGRT